MVQLVKVDSMVEAFASTILLKDLNNLYPDFDYWFVNKALPGIITGDDIMIVAKDGPNTLGVALGKSGQENKLRCIRVHPNHQNSGLGIRLIDRMIEELECEKPTATVAEEMFHQYSRAFINRYGFKLDEVKKGMYRPGKLEYLFNL